MIQRTHPSTAIRLAFTAVSTSLVCIATMVFSVYVPHTRGFFNIGETMIYTTALIFGPFIGSFAGGVGSMLADVLLGYPYYAPATLVIKACEGLIVGILGRKRPKFSSKLLWKAFTFSVGLVAGVLLSSIGSLYYSGAVELYVGIPPPLSPNIVFAIPSVFWYSLGALLVLLITLTGFVLEPEFGWLFLATLVGGTAMVTGYFLYQQFLLFPLFGIEVLAAAEIPVNIGQMVIGTAVAIPVVKIVLRSLPQLRS